MTDKASLRAAARAARAAMPADDREAARGAIRRAVVHRCRELELPSGALVAGYHPLPTEPGSVQLLDELTDAGYRVIVPHTLPDLDLDWLPWMPGTEADPAGGAELLGPTAVGSAALVLVPAFAVDRAGRRLGRGGGSYDRALSRVPAGTIVAALLFADEFVEQLPADPWDRPATAVVTPAGWLDLPATGRGNA